MTRPRGRPTKVMKFLEHLKPLKTTATVVAVQPGTVQIRWPSGEREWKPRRGERIGQEWTS